jgi:hypothetical protein
LNLVYNPIGATLPPDRSDLEQDYKAALEANFGIVCNRLYAITNMPIAQFLSQLKRESYERLLQSRFNPEVVEGLMCRSSLSIDWRGCVFDCDFNQMLGFAPGRKKDEIPLGI